jgi:hypothetical protein
MFIYLNVSLLLGKFLYKLVGDYLHYSLQYKEVHHEI